MGNEPVSALVGLSFVYGLIHALDADHVMAVSGLYGGSPGSNSLRLCRQWALGHGLVLLLAGISVYILGFVLPARFSEIADYLVALLLIAIGLGISRDLVTGGAKLQFHQHEGLQPHAHWYPRTASETASHRRRRDHRAMLVGVVHGAAGAAPMLAMFSLAHTRSPWLLVASILIFVSGIFIAMLFFGGALGYLMRRLLKHGDRVMPVLRSAVAAGSVSMGLFMLRGLLPGQLS